MHWLHGKEQNTNLEEVFSVTTLVSTILRILLFQIKGKFLIYLSKGMFCLLVHNLGVKSEIVVTAFLLTISVCDCHCEWRGCRLKSREK